MPQLFAADNHNVVDVHINPFVENFAAVQH
jgi:hypothetical protein